MATYWVLAYAKYFCLRKVNRSRLALELMHATFLQPVMVDRKLRTQPLPLGVHIRALLLTLSKPLFYAVATIINVRLAQSKSTSSLSFEPLISQITLLPYQSIYCFSLSPSHQSHNSPTSLELSEPWPARTLPTPTH